ncbi:MAG: hypothetical protein VB031_03000 [Eubacteriaceae bacterium]|nr:hypothetical protein [Eubacteriaceae bacterium]
MLYIPPEIEEEEKKIAEAYFNSDSDIGLDKWFNEHASRHYLKWSKETKKYRAEQKAKGILI